MSSIDSGSRVRTRAFFWPFEITLFFKSNGGFSLGQTVREQPGAVARRQNDSPSAPVGRVKARGLTVVVPDRARSPSASRRERGGRTHSLARWGAPLLVLALFGCSTPAPYSPPDLGGVGERFLQPVPGDLQSVDASAWRGFGDPALDALIAQARSANHDVRIAQQRVRQARAGSAAAASRLMPTVSATGALSDQRTGLPSEIKQRSPDVRAVRGAVEIGWELDLFGAARAASDAAELDALATEAGVEAAQWLASTEVARQYLVWQGARLRLRKFEALLQTAQDLERLTRGREAAGVASRSDVARASAEARSLAAQLPGIQTLVAVTEAQIRLLLGLGSEAPLSVLDARTPPALPELPMLTPGQPIELLQRRPDLRVAERQLLAEAARLRESQADQWPRLILGAVFGRQDLRLNGLDLSPSRFGNVALAFAAPVFNAGRLRAGVERQSARERVALLQYERAVLGALLDVENSLVALNQERERRAQLAAAVDSRREGLRYAQSLYREGQIDRLQLLEVERGLIVAEVAATDADTQRALGVVQLVKALGGGWYAAPKVSMSTTLRP